MSTVIAFAIGLAFLAQAAWAYTHPGRIYGPTDEHPKPVFNRNRTVVLSGAFGAIVLVAALWSLRG